MGLSHALLDGRGSTALKRWAALHRVAMSLAHQFERSVTSLSHRAAALPVCFNRQAMRVSHMSLVARPHVSRCRRLSGPLTIRCATQRGRNVTGCYSKLVHIASRDLSPTPLRFLHRLCEMYHSVSQLPLASPTFTHRLDPHWPLCTYDIRGSCRDAKCEFQHASDYQLENVAVLRDLHSQAVRSVSAYLHLYTLLYIHIL